MHRSKLVTTVAILATAAGIAALAGSAEAQISGTIGGDVVDNDPLHVLGDGHAAFPWGPGAVHVAGGGNASFRVRLDSYDWLGSVRSAQFGAS